MKKQWVIGWAFLSIDALLTTRIEADTQSPSSDFLALAQAIDHALEHYPSVRELPATYKETQAGIDIEETSFLPHVEIGVQGSRSTFNNVSGNFFRILFCNRSPVPIWDGILTVVAGAVPCVCCCLRILDLFPIGFRKHPCTKNNRSIFVIWLRWPLRRVI